MNAKKICKAAHDAWPIGFGVAAGMVLATAAWPSIALGANSSIDPDPAQPAIPSDPGVHVGTDRGGSLVTKDGLTLHLTTDLGTVRIVTLEPGAPAEVHYTVHIETDAHAPLAQTLLDHYSFGARATAGGVEITGSLPPAASRSGSGAQFWVQFEVAVPASYSLDINTGVGDIETQNIGGTANLVTQGGNIRTGRIGTMSARGGWQGRPLAKLSTEGGHIQVQDVAGDLDAFTAGGHIVAGNIAGSALLRTGGGHIRAGQIAGRAQLETDGGNITLKQAGNFVSVRTGGGQIDFGEVRGSVRAQTGGGGIHVITVSGPMEVESNGGSVCLTRVSGSVQAATGGGNIQAWINPETTSMSGTVSLAGPSQLSSGAGNILVFLPRNLAATIDVQVENAGPGRFAADSTLPLSFQVDNRYGQGLHAIGALNGGGPVLRLRTSGGKIQLQSEDSDQELRISLIREQQERIDRNRDLDFPAVTNLGSAPRMPPAGFEEKGDWLDGWMDHMEVWLFGGLHEDPKDFFNRLLARPNPIYPDLARRARIHGMVLVQVRVRTDGSVEVDKVLQGEPILVEAAKEALQRWRATPAVINGTKVEVISTVSFDFEF